MESDRRRVTRHASIRAGRRRRPRGPRSSRAIPPARQSQAPRRHPRAGAARGRADEVRAGPSGPVRAHRSQHRPKHDSISAQRGHPRGDQGARRAATEPGYGCHQRGQG